MVVYSILLVDLSPTSYCLTKPLIVYGSMLLLSTSILSFYGDQRKSYGGYVGVGLGIAHGTCLNARKRFCTCRLWIPLHDNYGNYSILVYILLLTQAPIPGCLDGTNIDSRIILLTMYYYCGYVGV